MFDIKKLTDVRKVTLDTITNTEICSSNIHGWGLFATALIKQGTQMCLLDGQIVNKVSYDAINKTISPNIPTLENYFFMECNYLHNDEILVRPLRTKYSYINHSSSPNLKIFYHPMRVVAVKNIQIGDELTIDYTEEPLSKEYLARPEKAFLKEK